MWNARTVAARPAALLLLPLLLLAAAPKKIAGTARGENEDLILSVKLYVDAASVKEAIGSSLDGHYIVAEVKVEPKYGKDITIDRDDFQLRTDKDGEKTKSFAPSQIAGRGALVITQTGAAQKRTGWSGMGGPVMTGGGGGIGSEGDARSSKATMQNSDKDDPLETVLASRILPEGKIDQPVSGLLYFPMEQQKLKDLELTYGGRENRISMRFK
jgi:hypothetical protein